MVIHMIEKLTPREVNAVAAHCDQEEIEEVFQVKDNKGGTYWQGRAHGALVKFTIEATEPSTPR